MKANHNVCTTIGATQPAVSNGSKILKWKQITTRLSSWGRQACCFQWFKDTKMKANHNQPSPLSTRKPAVSNGSKILKWKQITTPNNVCTRVFRCFQWFKDTKMKANHNQKGCKFDSMLAVSNGSKILKWKQITTAERGKADLFLLFPMVQRY